MVTVIPRSSHSPVSGMTDNVSTQVQCVHPGTVDRVGRNNHEAFSHSDYPSAEIINIRRVKICRLLFRTKNAWMKCVCFRNPSIYLSRRHSRDKYSQEIFLLFFHARAILLPTLHIDVWRWITTIHQCTSDVGQISRLCGAGPSVKTRTGLDWIGQTGSALEVVVNAWTA